LFWRFLVFTDRRFVVIVPGTSFLSVADDDDLSAAFVSATLARSSAHSFSS
jgi:hypothetical protein